MSENPIDAILARLKASTAPAVNPSVAAQVLDTATRAEVANEPAPTPAPAPAPASAPTVQAVVPAGPAPTEPKTRRTAAVVQQELDAALIRIAELEARAPEHYLSAGNVYPNAPIDDLCSVLTARGFRVRLEFTGKPVDLG